MFAAKMNLMRSILVIVFSSPHPRPIIWSLIIPSFLSPGQKPLLLALFNSLLYDLLELRLPIDVVHLLHHPADFLFQTNAVNTCGHNYMSTLKVYRIVGRGGAF